LDKEANIRLGLGVSNRLEQIKGKENIIGILPKDNYSSLFDKSEINCSSQMKKLVNEQAEGISKS
jgi:hypothetical protein